MEVLKTVEVPAHTETRVDYRLCDLCGQKIEKKSGEIKEVTLKAEVGSGCGCHGGATTVASFDICLVCFNTALRPFLESYGAKPHIYEVDW